jgi:GGDEF domain-containing protein
VLEGLNEGFAIGGRRLRVGVSIGIALGGVGYEDPPESLIREADAAMYEAKQSGSGYHIFLMSRLAYGHVATPRGD